MAKTFKTLRLTHLFLFGGERSETEAFYKRLIGVATYDPAEENIVCGGCVLAVREHQLTGMPIATATFTVFEASEDPELYMTTLGSRGLSFHEPIPHEGDGRVAYFVGPCDHLHCLWETKPGHTTSVARTSEAFQAPRIAYYFLAVDDLKVAIPFYRDVLGLSFIEAAEGLYALFNAGSIILGLRQGKDAGAGVDAESWTVFETSRCEELYGELKRFGAVPLGIRSEPHGKVFWFRAPGGHMQCFHDPHPDYALDNILKRPSMSA